MYVCVYACMYERTTEPTGLSI
jgi:hypothetical protein